MKINSAHTFLVCAIALTMGLVWVAGYAPSGGIFANKLHAPAHFGAFAILAFAWTRGLPKVPAPAMMLATVAFGIGHEAVEIVGHGHAFEIADAGYDAAGAITGVILARIPRPGTKTPPKRGQ